MTPFGIRKKLRKLLFGALGVEEEIPAADTDSDTSGATHESEQEQPEEVEASAEGDQLKLIEDSFAALAPAADDLVSAFYDRLFADYPAVRPLFKDDLTTQKRALKGALVMAVENLRKPDVLLPALRELGARHAGYGTQPAHYEAVRDTMLIVMGEMAGDLWTDELETAWRDTLNLVATTMIAGAEEN